MVWAGEDVFRGAHSMMGKIPVLLGPRGPAWDRRHYSGLGRAWAFLLFLILSPWAG